MRRPAVYLIGTGPGDPRLMTAHGLECLRSADVVVYDHGVSSDLLENASEGVELIDVGTGAPQPMAQEAISYLLAEKAREGKMVARLKCGDPFVFDRGGEEALFLHEQGVPLDAAALKPDRLLPGGGYLYRVPVVFPQPGPDDDWTPLAIALNDGRADVADFIRKLLAE